MKLKMAFDIDGTVIDLQTLLKKEFKRRYGVIVPDVAFSRFDISKVTGISIEKVEECISSCIKKVDKQKIYPGSKDFISRYQRVTGNIVLFVTNRVDKESTIKLLNKYFHDVPYEVFFVPENKSSILREKKVNVFIEDRFDKALEVYQSGLKVVLIERPWNVIFKEKSPDGLLWVKDWFELTKLFGLFI